MSDYIFPSQWLEKLSEKNIKEPSAVQKQIIPLLSENKNIIYQSETGTGKTLAYLIPLLEKIDPNIKEVQLLLSISYHKKEDLSTDFPKNLFSVFWTVF